MYKHLLYRNYRSYSGLVFRLGHRVTKIGWLVFSGVIISSLLGLDTNLSLAYQTSTLLFVVLFVSVVATFFARARLSAERNMPKFGAAGEPLHYDISIRNVGRKVQRGLSVMERMPDPRPTLQQFLNTPEPGEEKRNWYDRSQGWYRWQYLLTKNRFALTKEQALPPLAPGQSILVTAELVPTRRGILRLETLNAYVPDPFGLFRSTVTIPTEDSIVILPKRYNIPAVELPGITKYQQGGVSMASAIGESEEFVALRDYRSGDPLRHIHWRSYAKLGKPIVKEFQDEFFVRHALILDTFKENVNSDCFEEAVSVAASFAYTIQTQDSLLDLMFVGPEAYCFTAGRGVGQTEQMLEILAAVQLCSDKPFQTLEHLVIEHVGAVSGCICVFLTWDEARQSFIEQLKILGVPVLVLIVTETDVTLPLGPMADKPEAFRVLPLGKIEENLATL